MHSRVFLNFFAGLLLALCLLALLLGASPPAEAPSAAVRSTPATTLSLPLPPH